MKKGTIHLPEWVPEDFRNMVEELAKKRGMNLDEYLTWLWNNTTPEEAERYREIAETYVWIMVLHEELSDLMSLEDAEIELGKEDLLKSTQMINEVQSLIKQAKKYQEEGLCEEAEELLRKADTLLKFNEQLLKSGKERLEKIRTQSQDLLNEIKALTQKLIELTNGGDDKLLNTAKIYALLDALQEVSQ